MRWSVGAKIASGFSLTLVIFLVVGGAGSEALRQWISTSENKKTMDEIRKMIADDLGKELKDVINEFTLSDSQLA